MTTTTMAMTIETSQQPWASFDVDWRPADYLAEYYQTLEQDEVVTMRFLVDTAARLPHVPCLLEFGCGPTMHHLFPFTELADEIHVADYLAGNLDAVGDWVEDRPGAHDWSPFARFTLECERRGAAADAEVYDREERLRRLVTSRRRADARIDRPLLDHAGPARYPLVVCCFCPDSITDDITEWRRCMANVASLVEPGGWLVVTALGEATSYRVGARRYPSAMVDHGEMALALAPAAGFVAGHTRVVTEGIVDEPDHGYASVVMGVGRKAEPGAGASTPVRR